MICKTIPLNETAHFDTYFLNNSNEYNVGKKRPFVLVLPGGAYAFTSDRLVIGVGGGRDVNRTAYVLDDASGC